MKRPRRLPKPWKVKGHHYKMRSYFDTLRADRCVTPQGKIIERYCIAEHPDWVNSFLITQDLQVVMIWQYRHGIGKVVIELAGGCIDESDNGSVEAAARREAGEEVGYEGGHFIN